MRIGYRLIALLLIGILFLSIVPAYAITSAEKEKKYSAAILQLEVYLQSAGNSSAELFGIRSSFDSLGGYEQSRFLGYYTSVLMKIADEEYDYELYMFLDMLERNQSFNAYLKESLKGSSIGSVEELKAYAHGREYEHDGANSEAINCYSECLNYFDASARYFKLQREKDQSIYDEAAAMLNRGDLAGAYFKFSDILRFKDSKGRRDSIVSLLGYTPSSPTDNLMPVTGLKVTSTGISSITLLWNKSNHATGYEVYYKKYNANNWINAGSEKNTTKTITGLEQGMSYDFKVIATIGVIKADSEVLPNQKTLTITPTPLVTATPVPKQTATPSPKPTLVPTSTPLLGLSSSVVGLKYKKIVGGISITGYYGLSTNLEIPAYLDGNKVVSIGVSAFSGCTRLISVIIPDTVTRIDSSAFNGCSNLTIVEIPDTVSYIGINAFYNCNSLISIAIPAGVTKIRERTFYGCSSLSSIKIPDSVTSIAFSVFSGCSNLTIYGTSNSAAEKYAKKNGIRFKSKDNVSNNNNNIIGTVTINGFGINVRKEAGIEFDVVTVVENGEKYPVYESKRGANGNLWYYINANDEWGWVSSGVVQFK